MLYVNQGKLGFIYFVITVSSTVLPFVAAHYAASYNVWHFDPRPIAGFLGLAISVIGSYHCYSIAQKGIKNLKFYAHWYVLLSPLIFMIIFRESICRPYHIDSASMSPNVNVGDFLFADLFAYYSHAPQRGDIVIIKSPKLPLFNYIKRIIGMPGERVQLKEGIVYINDVPLPRRQIDQFDNNGASYMRYIDILPEGKEISILQQNRNNGGDNTQVYEVPPGHYFVLGDNRDNSRDSRYLYEFGYVPEMNIIGKASLVIWNTNTYQLSYKLLN